MREVIEHYGISLLETMALVCVIFIVVTCYGAGGVISDIVNNYLMTICGWE